MISEITGCQTNMTKLFAQIFNGFLVFSYFRKTLHPISSTSWIAPLKRSIIDVWQGSHFACERSLPVNLWNWVFFTKFFQLHSITYHNNLQWPFFSTMIRRKVWVIVLQYYYSEVFQTIRKGRWHKFSCLWSYSRWKEMRSWFYSEHGHVYLIHNGFHVFSHHTDTRGVFFFFCKRG